MPVLGAHEASPLQRWDEPFGHLANDPPAQGLVVRGDEEPIAADLFDDLAHAIGNVVGCSDQLDRGCELRRVVHQLPQCLPASPLLELVERALLTVGRQMWQLRALRAAVASCPPSTSGAPRARTIGRSGM